MRILHLVNTLDVIGNGITNVAADLALDQHSLGEQVLIGSRMLALAPVIEAAHVAHVEIDFADRSPRAVAAAVRRLAHTIREFRPDVVHCHTIAPTVLARLVCLPLPRVRVVATVHNEYQRGVGLMRAAHHLVGVSQAVTDSMVRRGRSRQRISTVLNGTVGSARLPAQVASHHFPGPTIVTCGAVTERKGADVLVAAFEVVAATRPDAHLAFVGALDWPAAREIVAASPVVDQISLLGFQPDPRPYLAAATVFVLPSRREPMGLVLFEAMHLGTPAVGSDVDGIPEVLDHGRAGVLVPPADSAALATVLGELLDDETRRLDLGAAGARRAALFTTRRMAEEYLVVYDRVLRGRGRGGWPRRRARS